jgi:hypothetical protein
MMLHRQKKHIMSSFLLLLAAGGQALSSVGGLCLRQCLAEGLATALGLSLGEGLCIKSSSRIHTRYQQVRTELSAIAGSCGASAVEHIQAKGTSCN